MAQMPNKVFRCQLVLGIGPLGSEPTRQMRPEYWTQEMSNRGILTTTHDVDVMTQDLDEDVKLLVRVQATSAEGIRWYVREHLGVTEDEPAWEEMERQLHKVHDPEE